VSLPRLRGVARGAHPNFVMKYQLPNILVMMGDQWRGSAVGYAGDANVKTPNIDRLERESVNFVQAVSGLPVCAPARASQLTGQRPLTHGVFMNGRALRNSALTIADVLNSSYDTAYVNSRCVLF
jgi:arylsulfatase A-like enzyme